MSFGSLLFTTKGRALQSKALAGTQLNFTRMEMGSGSLGSTSQITLNALIEPQVSIEISSIIVKSGTAAIRGNFTNEDITSGFYWRELGVYATDPDLGEILYCYANAGSLAEYIPLQESELIEKVISLSVIVGDVSNVSATIDDSILYIEAISRLESGTIDETGYIVFLDQTDGIHKKTLLSSVAALLKASFDSLYSAINHTHTGIYAAATHTHAASSVTAGTLGGQVNANATAQATLTTAQVRDAYFGTTDMTAGSTSLTTGVLYGMYE